MINKLIPLFFFFIILAWFIAGISVYKTFQEKSQSDCIFKAEVEAIKAKSKFVNPDPSDLQLILIQREEKMRECYN